MGIISVIFILFAFVFLIIISVNWLTHIEMTKLSTERYGWASFEKFKQEFDKVENWKTDKVFTHSLFSIPYRQNQIHASVICFDYKGMLINNPFSYIFAVIYTQCYISKMNKKKAIKW